MVSSYRGLARFCLLEESYASRVTCGRTCGVLAALMCIRTFSLDASQDTSVSMDDMAATATPPVSDQRAIAMPPVIAQAPIPASASVRPGADQSANEPASMPSVQDGDVRDQSGGGAFPPSP